MQTGCKLYIQQSVTHMDTTLKYVLKLTLSNKFYSTKNKLSIFYSEISVSKFVFKFLFLKYSFASPVVCNEKKKVKKKMLLLTFYLSFNIQSTTFL